MKFGLVLRYKFVAGVNSFAEIYKKKQVSRLLFLVLGFLFLVFIYLLSYRFINYIRGVSLLGPILISKFFEMLFVIFFSMLGFSSLISGFNVIFSSRDMNFLTNLPLTDSEIYLVKYLETLFHSSWMVFILFVPFFVATGVSHRAGPFFYSSAFLNFFLFIIAATSIGFFISVFLIRLFPTRKVRDLFLLLGVAAGCGFYVFFRVLQPEKLVNPKETMGVLEYMASLSTPIERYLPSYWMTKALLLSAVSSFALSLKWALYNLLFAVFTFGAAFFTFRKNFIAISQNIKNKTGSGGRFNFSRKGTILTLLTKDAKIFFRDTAQWSQMLLLSALIVVYVFNIYKLPLDSFYLKNLVAFLNITMAGFVVSAICLRFVFTSLSLEGKSFWIVRASPVNIKKYVFEKLLLNGIPVIFVALPVVIVSNLVLKISGVIFISSIITIIFLTLTLLVMAMGFGMMYPKFDYENPIQIESSFGGFLYMVYAFFLIAVTVSLEAWPMKMHFMYIMGHKSALSWGAVTSSLTALLAIYFFAGYFSIKTGLSRLEKYNL